MNNLGRTIQVFWYGPEIHSALLVVFILGASALVANIFPTVGSLICLISYFLYRYPVSSHFNYHYDIPPLIVFLVIFAASWESSRRKPDIGSQISAWPQQLIRLYLGMIYFSAACAKIQNSGAKWFSGESLKSSFIERSLVLESPIPVFLAEHIWLCVILAWLTLLFEGFFWTVVLWPRFRLFYVIAGVSFHAMISLTMGLDFSFFFAPTYLALIPYSEIYTYVHRLNCMRPIKRAFTKCDGISTPSELR